MLLIEQVRPEVGTATTSDIIKLRDSLTYENHADLRYLRGGFIDPLTEEEFVRRCSDTGHGVVFVASSNEGFRGYLRMTFERQESLNWAKLQSIAVVPGTLLKDEERHTKTGVGTQLFREALRVCKEKKVSYILSEVFIYPIPNVASLRFHQKIGFAIESSTPLSVIQKNGNPVTFATFRFNLD